MIPIGFSQLVSPPVFERHTPKNNSALGVDRLVLRFAGDSHSVPAGILKDPDFAEALAKDDDVVRRALSRYYFGKLDHTWEEVIEAMNEKRPMHDPGVDFQQSLLVAKARDTANEDMNDLQKAIQYLRENPLAREVCKLAFTLLQQGEAKIQAYEEAVQALDEYKKRPRSERKQLEKPVVPPKPDYEQCRSLSPETHLKPYFSPGKQAEVGQHFHRLLALKVLECVIPNHREYDRLAWYRDWSVQLHPLVGRILMEAGVCDES